MAGVSKRKPRGRFERIDVWPTTIGEGKKTQAAVLVGYKYDKKKDGDMRSTEGKPYTAKSTGATRRISDLKLIKAQLEFLDYKVTMATNESGVKFLKIFKGERALSHEEVNSALKELKALKVKHGKIRIHSNK